MAESKRKRGRPGDAGRTLLLRQLEDALRRSGAIDEMSPRLFVDLMTSSSFEIGRIFKRGLKDALYEQQRDVSRNRSRARRGTDT